MADLATIEWCQWDERADAANHPEGYPDVVNRPNRTIWDVFCLEHNKDGTHKAGLATNFHLAEIGSYVGDGIDDRVINLSNADLCIRQDNGYMMIWSEETEFSHFGGWPWGTQSAGAHDGWTKLSNADLLGTFTLLENYIQDIATEGTTTGTFEVGTEDGVNKNGVTYYYLFIGWVA